MGARGPAPKPTTLRVLEGNPSKRPINKDEPKPVPKAPGRPDWLLPEAKHEWSRVVPELERLGLLTVVDRAALATYCQAWARYVEAEEKLSQYGGVLKAKQSDYVQVSPYSTISRQNAQIVRAFCGEFGLTPSSRGRMSVGKLDDDEEPSWLD
ncbi:hypothetical protein LCGC14_1677380 [marine sediment metagenome]|uniref:Phage terminase small subunit P27 family n=1 Tax=marine sediment metagenome TaxID=412755 RepID=A0A0F9HQ40_9ZZZZ